MVPIYVVDIVARTCLIVLSAVFAVRIIRTNKRRSTEQIWTVVMVTMTSLSYNPVLPVIILHDQIIYADNISAWWVVRYDWCLTLTVVNRGICLILSSVGQLFYVWAVSHTFGILEEMHRPSNILFYGPKIFILTTYNVYRLILSQLLGIAPSKLPFITGVAMFVQFQALNVWENDKFRKVSVLIAMELIIMIAIIRRMCITARVLREAQYVKHRNKQIGFRYFVYQNIITYSLFVFADISIMVLVPRSAEIVNSLRPETNFYNIFFNIIFGPVPRLLNYATTAVTAYG